MRALWMALRAVLLATARLAGSPIHDARTGKYLGRALLLPFRGRIHVVGLQANVIPAFLPQENELSYWKQELGFTTHPAPDFPHEPGA